MLGTQTKHAIKVGDTVPDFKLNDQFGKPFSPGDFKGKKNLVIYFYPKDDTPGCTKEACSFRDYAKDFEGYDALILGISDDSEKSHAEFAEKYRLNFRLLADTGGSVRKAFGVPTNLLGLIPGRVTYVIDKEGTVRHIFNSQTKPEKHIDESLKVLADLQ